MKQVLNIDSEKDIYPSESVLLMEIGETDCSFGLMHHASRTLYKAAYYKADSTEEEAIQKVFDSNEILSSAFYRTAIAYYISECILIPNKFYDDQLSLNLLESMFGKDSSVSVTESLPEWQLHTAYHVSSVVHDIMNRYYAAGNFWHHYSVTLKNSNTKPATASVMVDFKTDSFSAVVLNNNSLQLAQIFSYTSAEDVLYYLLKICRQFSFSQNEVFVLLSGLVDRESAVFKELYQYFLNIEFASLENGIQLSERFHEYPVHFFTSLSRLAACVS